MPLYEISFDPFSAFARLDSLRAERPRDRSRYDVARRRAAELFAEFEASDEHATLEEGARWTTLVLHTAYVHHGVTVDELTPEVLQDVASRFVADRDLSSLAHWAAVVHVELVAFFRFLERKGFANASRNLQMLEDVILPAVDTKMKAASDALVMGARPLPAGMSPGSFVVRRHGTGTSSPAERRARRKAQRTARRKNR